MYRIPPPLNHLPLRINRQQPGTSLILLLLLAGIALTMSACSKDPGNEHRSTILVFGTLIEITLFDTTQAKANAAFDQLEHDFYEYHASWTPWETSDLSRINDAIRAGTEVVVPDSVLPMITASKALFEQSEGLFNPAIGNLINLWQMHLHEDPDIRPPDTQDIARVLRQNPRMSDIQIDGSVLHSSNPDVQLSLGAFAKGYAIDLAMDYLRSQGITNAVINAGGDLRVAGQHGERPWRIGIRHPRADGLIAWIDAQADESIFTSGDYERYYQYGGRRYHHILDPRTGYPATETSSVTVIHGNAGTADAAATALFVAGPEQWHEIARAMGVRFVMLIDTEGRIHMNPAMKDRINLINPESAHIVLSQPL
jgi:thiamine biosynthesis lipoprotein